MDVLGGAFSSLAARGLMYVTDFKSKLSKKLKVCTEYCDINMYLFDF